MSGKTRLDVALFESGRAESREKARALIMEGVVYLNGRKALKAGVSVGPADVVEVRKNPNPYVSRGGLKLAKAVKNFRLDLSGLVCMDVGASTGGFTDCMLVNGASKVYSIDVGYGQLAWKLRTDERVVNLERTNFRYVTKEQIPEEIDFACADVSFISLKLILPVIRGFLKPEGRAVCLIKPQFEAGKEKVGKNGVVRDAKTREEAIETTARFAAENGFAVLALDYSPVKGPAGNVEYLIYLEKRAEGANLWEGSVSELVARSREELEVKRES